MPTRWTVLRAITAAALLAVLTTQVGGPSEAVAAGESQAPRQPNVLFVLMDNLGHGELGSYGGGGFRTRRGLTSGTAFRERRMNRCSPRNRGRAPRAFLSCT